MLARKLLFAMNSMPELPNLLGASAWVHDDIVYPKGTYKVEIGSGASWKNLGVNIYEPTGVGFTQTIVMKQKFVIRAYCGGAGSPTDIGRNPYSGPYKRSAVAQEGAQANGGIFGNSGGNTVLVTVRTGSRSIIPKGGPNCLGDGAKYENNSVKFGGAGSCLHFMPVGGVFGTDYLACFHCAGSSVAAEPTSSRGPAQCAGGGGGAYGGGGGAGRAMSTSGAVSYFEGWAGGPAAGGNGGAGGGTAKTHGATAGSKGAGVGAGDGGGAVVNTSGSVPATGFGGVAFYNGSTWSTPTRIIHSGQGYIRITRID